MSVNLNISQIAMYGRWYCYAKQKYGGKEKLCYTNKDTFIVHVKFKDVNLDLAGHVEKRFDTSSYVVKRPLSIGGKTRN